MHKTPLDDQEQEVQAIAESAGREDRGIHLRHGEQLLGFEHAVTETVLGEPMNISATTMMTSAGVHAPERDQHGGGLDLIGSLARPHSGARPST